MYPVPLGMSFMVSQKASGSGAFTGADYGRARVSMSNADPNAIVRAAAKLYGTTANALTMEFIDRGAGNAVAATVVEQVGSALRVILRRASGGSPLATSAEVAAALNAYNPGSNPVGAVAGGDGTGVVSAASPTAFAGGVNPTVDGFHTFRWAPSNTNVGLFHVEQESAVLVRQLDAKFTVPSGTRTLTVSRAPLNAAFEPDLTESVPLFQYETLTSATPSIVASDMNWLLPPRWCLLVETSVALVGLVRMDFRRDI